MWALCIMGILASCFAIGLCFVPPNEHRGAQHFEVRAIFGRGPIRYGHYPPLHTFPEKAALADQI